jgi:SPX domain protein involved in polyphosphate accumulation
MSLPPNNHRFERKFIPDGLAVPEVLALVRRHPALFRQTYPPRVINNLYLDSPALRDYHDHIGGTAYRAKTRIRWYGPLSGHVLRPTLERKIKCGAVGSKLSFPLPAFTLDERTSPHEMFGFLLRGPELAESIRLALRTLEPVLVNRYHRSYFLSADRTCRLTVDSEFRFFGPDRPLTAQTPVSAPDPRIVIELKYDPDQAPRAADITRSFPFRLGRCSKYVLGIDSLQRTMSA